MTAAPLAGVAVHVNGGAVAGVVADLGAAAPAADAVASPMAVRLLIGGCVQGVGYRPYACRAAAAHGVAGHVRNAAGGVEVLAQAASAEQLDGFARALLAAPAPARPVLLTRTLSAADPGRTAFCILDSSNDGPASVSVLPDQSVCDECLRDMTDRDGRRHGHVFVSCARCGPRYTIVDDLPWDRPRTAMSAFAPCAECGREYAAPGDRRFHAETLACPACGPRLCFSRADAAALMVRDEPPEDGGRGAAVRDDEAAIAASLAVLRGGGLLAAKGIGGYHLLCDARNEAAVARLRDRKHRPSKPLAVMYPLAGDDGLAALRADLAPTPGEAEALRDPARPIVPVRCRADSNLAPGIAPGLAEVGALLPYSPLHARLLSEFGGPLVATSANPSGEPVVTDSAAAVATLGGVADAFLRHDRPIRRPADDAVRRVIAGRSRAVRLGRGDAPLELRLAVPVRQPCLALGGEGKVTLALAVDDRVIVSPHIGNVDRPRSLALLARLGADMQRLHGVRARRLLVDAHPGYASARWAREQGLPVTRVWHHHAHASALVAEAGGDRPRAVFTWDAVGLGPDGHLWGGETLLGSPGAWQRVASLRPFRPPGGDRVAREPWRSALALAWEAGCAVTAGPPELQRGVRLAWEQGLNAPVTTAAGRLFDGLAALVLGLGTTGYEAEAPARLEALATGWPGGVVPLPLATQPEAGRRCIDWAPLVGLAAAVDRDPRERAAIIHASLAAAIHAECRHLRDCHGVTAVGLAGGVFQNRVLVEAIVARLADDGFAVELGERIPANDGGLAVGQVVEFAAQAQG